MTTAGFYEPRRMNPRALAVVVLLHGAALAALVLVKGEEFRKIIDPPTTVELIDETKPPPERHPPPPQPDRPQPPDSHVTVTPRDILLPLPSDFPVPPAPPLPSGPIAGPAADPVPDVPPAPPPPPPAPRIEPARAKANLGSYISDSDYPAAAIRSEEHGTTRFRLAVGPDGRVTDCVVTGSSGSSALDSATCRIMKARARFSPAHDTTGRPTGDSVASAIRWVLPDG
jgi:protein TonB